MTDVELVIKISEKVYNALTHIEFDANLVTDEMRKSIANGTPLPKGHGRLGDLDELEQRIRNFVEHDAKITDAYTVTRQRFIVDGISETPTIIEADKGD